MAGIFFDHQSYTRADEGELEPTTAEIMSPAADGELEFNPNAEPDVVSEDTFVSDTTTIEQDPYGYDYDPGTDIAPTPGMINQGQPEGLLTDAPPWVSDYQPYEYTFYGQDYYVDMLDNSCQYSTEVFYEKQSPFNRNKFISDAIEGNLTPLSITHRGNQVNLSSLPSPNSSNIVYPSFSELSIRNSTSDPLLSEQKDYLFFKWYDHRLSTLVHIDLGDIRQDVFPALEGSVSELNSKLFNILPRGTYEDINFSINEEAMFFTNINKSLSLSINNRGAEEHRIESANISSYDRRNNILTRLPQHSNEFFAVKMSLKKPKKIFSTNKIAASFLALLLKQTRGSFSSDNYYNQVSIRNFEVFNLEDIRYETLSEDDFSDLSISYNQGSFLELVSEPQDISYNNSINLRSLKKIFEGSRCCTELFVTEVRKFNNNNDSNPIQAFYFVGDMFINNADNFDFIDNQLCYDKEYRYEVYEYYFVYGNKITVSPSSVRQDFVSKDFNAFSYVEYINKSSTKVVKVKAGQFITKVFANPYSEPSVEFIPQKGKKNKISLYLENSNSTTRLEENELGLMYPKILDGDYIREQYLASEEQQRVVSYSAVSEHSSTPSNLGEIISSTSEFYFRYDAESGIEPKYFEVFRTANRPLNYSDFANSLHARISCKDSEGKIKSSFMFDDSVAENTKYWYMVRVVDTADQPSLPSKIYEYEMVKENDVLIPTITSIDLNPLPKKEVATAKKVVRISPRPEHVILGTDGEIQASDFEWGSKYKIKMRSVKTGKKIDINFKSTKPNKESIE